MTMTALQIADKLMKLHTENLIHSKIYCKRIASKRGQPIKPVDSFQIYSFIEIAALSFGLEQTIDGLVSIVELDVLRNYNKTIYDTIEHYKSIGTNQSFNNCYEDDCNFFITFAASLLP